MDFTIHSTSRPVGSRHHTPMRGYPGPQAALDAWVAKHPHLHPTSWSPGLSDRFGGSLPGLKMRLQAEAAGRHIRTDVSSGAYYCIGVPADLGEHPGQAPAERTPSPNVPLKGGKPRIVLVHELPRTAEGYIAPADDIMDAVRASAGGRRTSVWD